MVWLAVVALILAAGAIAIGVIARQENATLTRDVSGHTAELERLNAAVTKLQTDVDVATKGLDAEHVQVSLSRKDLDKAVESAAQQTEQLRQLLLRADAHFVSADADAVLGTRLVAELEHYAVDSLEQQAAGSRPRILRGGLYAQRPVRELVPDLVDGFLTALKAGLMYRQADPPDGSRFYLRWPGDLPSPDLLLDTLLKAASVAAKPVEPAGTTELRTLLHAMHGGSTGFLFVGPLVIERLPTRLLAGIAPSGWSGPSDDQKTQALDGNNPPVVGQTRQVLDWPTELTA